MVETYLQQNGRTKSAKLTLLTVNYHTSDFIENMLYCLHKITHNPFRVLIVDNFYSDEETLKIKKICSNYDNVETFFRKQSQFGAIGHGEALDFLTQRVDTDHFAILDADATFLIKNWDELLTSNINTQCKVIGTQAPINQAKKPIDFPLMFAILFETVTFQKLDIKFKPTSEEHALKGKDTGYQLRQRYMDAGKTGKLLYHTYSIKEKDSPFYGIACAEYYLPRNNAIIASHFWRGATLAMSENISLDNRLYYLIRRTPVVGGRAINFTRKMQKKKWLKICKNIVNQQ